MSALKTSKAGKVTRTVRNKGFHVKMTEAELERFGLCVVAEAAMLGGDANASNTARALIRQYCDRIEAIAKSETARDAAKVLRRKAA